jgi:hypothetical protein
VQKHAAISIPSTICQIRIVVSRPRALVVSIVE